MYRHWESLSISLLIHLLILTQNYFAVRALYPRRKRGGFTARSDKAQISLLHSTTIVQAVQVQHLVVPQTLSIVVALLN